MSEPFRPYEKLVEITLLGKKIPSARTQFVATLFSIHQSGDDSLRAFLLESGLSILPGNLPTAR